MPAPSTLTTSLLCLALAALLAGCATAPPPAPAEPEAASGYADQPGGSTRHFAVAAANPLAAQAGRGILRAGGTAVDAAVAVQMVLALVEPQSSGIGGGAFLLHFDGRQVQAFDGRETAPAAADAGMFLGPDGRPIPFEAAVVGGLSVGVPGAVRMLELAHRQHGKLPWARLFEPAIRLAEDGFEVSPRLHRQLGADAHLAKDPVARAYFFDAQGRPHRVGHRLRNPELAAVLRRLAREGADALHRGEIAQAIVDKVQGHPARAGRLTLADLAGYQPRQREPICHDWRAGLRDYRVCGFPPPGSGAIAIGQMLGMLQRVGAASSPLDEGLPSAAWLHLYTEAARLAYADRAQYVADPDFVAAPAGSWASLLAPDYLAQRASLIGERSMKSAPPGMPARGALPHASAAQQPESGTSHISIADAHGNVLALTTTIESQFGSRLMVQGFLLNNQLTDFSFLAADAAGKPVANRVEPGKRPRSSMSPTLVFDRATGDFVMSTGSAGGAQIIHYVAKSLYGVLEWGLDAQQAISLPNFGSTNGPTELEGRRFPRRTIDGLTSRGHEVLEATRTSGTHALRRTPGGFSGGADPRREGIVLGD